ncbi:MAG: hypothetical protein EXS59_02580 [Candidatus Taylorbacteria bacterium]|nr:hypothetical protein [Candidatus Taylorbacteria bacterium]
MRYVTLTVVFSVIFVAGCSSLTEEQKAAQKARVEAEQAEANAKKSELEKKKLVDDMEVLCFRNKKNELELTDFENRQKILVKKRETDKAEREADAKKRKDDREAVEKQRKDDASIKRNLIAGLWAELEEASNELLKVIRSGKDEYNVLNADLKLCDWRFGVSRPTQKQAEFYRENRSKKVEHIKVREEFWSQQRNIQYKKIRKLKVDMEDVQRS